MVDGLKDASGCAGALNTGGAIAAPIFSNIGQAFRRGEFFAGLVNCLSPKRRFRGLASGFPSPVGLAGGRILFLFPGPQVSGSTRLADAAVRLLE